MFTGSRQAALADLGFQKRTFINVYMLIVLRQSGLPLFVHHKEELDHFFAFGQFLSKYHSNGMARDDCSQNLGNKQQWKGKITFLTDSHQVCFIDEPEVKKTLDTCHAQV